MAFVRAAVNDCVLTFVDKDLILPVAKFDVNYQLDAIPTLTVIPALGRSLSSGTQAFLKDVSVRDKVQLNLTINGSTRLLFEGYVSSISAGDNSNIFQRRLSASIQIKHNLIVLSGAPSVSFVYSGNSGEDLMTLEQRRAAMTSAQKASSKNTLVSWIDMFINIKDELGEQAAFFPTSVLKWIAQELSESFNPEIDVDALINVYDPANLNNITTTGETVLNALNKTFTQGWLSSNCWNSLVRTCRKFFLHLVPFNTGVYICNPTALIRTPSVNILSKEYISIKETDADTLNERIDGVIIKKPGSYDVDAFEISFPETSAIDSPAKKAYFHYRSFPDWLYNEAELRYGAGQGKVTETNRATVDAKDSTTPSGSLSDHYQTVGERIAKAVFSEARTKKSALTLVFPYREDLMPGTIVKIENSGAEDMNFIGETLYGMVRSTRFTCDMLSESGTLNTSIIVGGVRNEIDNASDNFTFEKHPIYQENWVGSNLAGNMLSEAPKSDTLKEPTPSTNSSDPVNPGFKTVSGFRNRPGETTIE